jgi:hypothetical protein
MSPDRIVLGRVPFPAVAVRLTGAGVGRTRAQDSRKRPPAVAGGSPVVPLSMVRRLEGALT